MDSEHSNSTSGTAAPPVFLTGASGHVGANLVRKLLDDGARVRVFLRPKENNAALEGLDVERVYGDLRDINATREAVAGCHGVFHTAAHVSTIEGDDDHRRDVFESNVIGTRNVLQAAREAEAGRVVVTGSFSAVGYDLDDPSAPARESMPFYPMERTMPYERSKAIAETECWQAAAGGQDVVIATSCAVVGGNDFVPSRMGRTICDFANRKLHAYVDGGFEFVATADIVQGHQLCMERGRTGQKYIFSSEFKTISNMLDLFQEVTGVQRPRRQIPVGLMLAFTEVASYALSRLYPSYPQRFTPGAIRLLQLRRHADTSKAKEELGFQPTTMRSAIEEAYAFHYGQGAITNPRAKRPEQRVAAGE
jgi:nucleoside-diphosphate-sugar epimerase